LANFQEESMPFTTSLLWQNDPRWAATALGYGPQTIKDWGCLTTALTMVVNGCGYNETPPSLSQKMVAIGAFSGAAINAYRLGQAFPGVSLHSVADCDPASVPLAQIDTELANNKPVVVRVDQSPAAGIQDHWVLLYAKSGSDYLMWDPWCYSGDVPGKPLLLTSRYKNSGLTAAQAIVSVIFFDISGNPQTVPAPATISTPASPQPVPTTKLPIPADAIKLLPATDQLALRAAGDLTAALLRRLALDTTLTSLESRAATLAKVGQMNQWINVQAPEGDQGFVAAWYVSTAGGSAAAPSTPAPTQPSVLTVKTTQDQVAFRSQPVIADSTLITRVPLGTTFTLSNPNGAQNVGMMNAWLSVKDSSGREGYVAAWLVSW
jgi:hypothetical protein